MEVLSVHGSIGKKVNPLVSVVIPVKNGEPWLREVLQLYRLQTVAHKMEIIVIDSGSTDGSISICKEFGAMVHEIDPSSFNHGLTRNLGVQLSKGEFIFMTVQDAFPASNQLLEELLNVFNVPEVVGVCGLQVVPVAHNTNPFAWHRPTDAPEISFYQFSKPSDFDSLPAAEKREVCRWDDVCAMYRREVITRFTFPSIAFGEDMAWCKAVLRSGHKIAYNPKAKVCHYHVESGPVLYKRALAEFYAAYQLFDLLPEWNNSVMRRIKQLIHILTNNQVPWPRKWYWLNKEWNDSKTIQQCIVDFKEKQKGGPLMLQMFHDSILKTNSRAEKTLAL